MAGVIFEFFGYRATDKSPQKFEAQQNERCPFIGTSCVKRFSDGVLSGVCTIKPMTTAPVICCPIRLYSDKHKILRDISDKVFEPGLTLVQRKDAVQHAIDTGKPCVAVFGKAWGGELRLPQKQGSGGYFVDWVLARISADGELTEFVAVEVQTIDTTGTYRNGYESLKASNEVLKTTAGLNWENVAKRILPQLIYKGQVLQREELCKSGLFFVCPQPVYDHIMRRVGGKDSLVRYALQPASITFMVYDLDHNKELNDGDVVPLHQTGMHSTTVYKLQEAFNNVTLPEENVYKNAILKALGK